MDIVPAPPPAEPGGGRQNNGRPPRRRGNNANPAPDASNDARRNPPDAPASVPGSSRGPKTRKNERKPPRSTHDSHPKSANGETNAAPAKRRGRGFNGGLTDGRAGGPSLKPYRPKYDLPDTAADDLTSTLTRSLSVHPYADCPICFSAIHPAQPTWCCSPEIPVIDDNPQYCWTPFHLKCVRSWAEKSHKEVREAWIARGQDRNGEWRCPGCQGKRHELPKGYKCFCGSTPSPNTRLATPHSCGNPCSRVRKGCPHPCPLPCHPGPCPPCKIMLEVPCPCPRSKVVPIRCGEDTRITCGEPCSRELNCGKHQCQRSCHPGPCASCDVSVTQTCWCADNSRQITCGLGEKWGDGAGCNGEAGVVERLGYQCGKICARTYDCGVHTCEKTCHPLVAKSSVCPLAPSQIATCPCGKKIIGADFPERTSCEDPVPKCDAPCLKPYTLCEHSCMFKCHLGDCPPCQQVIKRPCRCGFTTQSVKCCELYATDDETGLRVEVPVMCSKPCLAQRACGKHQCNRVCCPLASLAPGKGKKRRAEISMLAEDREGWHECDLVCGRLLSCGNHRCEQRDHIGMCPPCLQSSFEEAICFCGQTVLEPPVPCGTQVRCPYPCVMAPPPCGHPKTPHVCHADDVQCPACPYLTDRLCACGAKTVGNMKCSLARDKISCGTVCGKPLDCGAHRCPRVCHVGECAPCTTPCGKPRKLCLPAVHACTEPCHAPATCSEVEPCQTVVELTCPCGRIKQTVRCGRSTTNPGGRHDGIKCTSECDLAKRNARLASALGINTAGRALREDAVYSEDLLAFGRANDKFVALVERTFKEFVASAKKIQVLPHMPGERRQFVLGLAEVYRMDTQMVDQEPHRSVQLIRRIDTRMPAPLLSTVLAATHRPGLGRLGNLRSVGGSSVGSGVANASDGGTRPNKSWGPPSGGPASVQLNPSAGAYRPPGARSGVSTPTAPASRVATPPVAASSRAATPPVARVIVPLPSVPATDAPSVSPGDVPDDWEDDE
ncbi:hypothetical protein CYLTODRAFT_491180 [Cylindrobasidium torrendii FP15055 ss-10]|uniref:NF-X1-type domain-containing protein n=1 Tax=Cylindrobasidium torrendii FP15055 ss-10 TaxID=1314674 RepID=A0A0D7BB84_9AGAR|nr:hypothetical protein CYLTODRAFT_491180 [Cylindrobasidium torrendii FP15055 ss-10]